MQNLTIIVAHCESQTLSVTIIISDAYMPYIHTVVAKSVVKNVFVFEIHRHNNGL